MDKLIKVCHINPVKFYCKWDFLISKSSSPFTANITIMLGTFFLYFKFYHLFFKESGNSYYFRTDNFLDILCMVEYDTNNYTF